MRLGKTMALLTVFLGSWGMSAWPATPDSGPFDGRWDVTLICPRSADGALPFAWEFGAEVKHSALYGVHGTEGQPGWMVLDGTIGANGRADLTAHGLTGLTDYNLNHTEQGAPWEHPVKARFEAAHGDGHWVAPRTCEFKFEKVKP